MSWIHEDAEILYPFKVEQLVVLLEGYSNVEDMYFSFEGVDIAYMSVAALFRKECT